MDDLGQVEKVIELTAKIVAAFVQKNSVAVADLGEFIHGVHGALVAAAQPNQIAPEPAQPAVSVKKSIRPDAIICMDCGKPMKMLRRHLTTEHHTTVEDYRAKWNLPADYPMTAPDYASTRSIMAKKFGLGRKPKPETVDAPVAEKPKRTQKKPKPLLG